MSQKVLEDDFKLIQSRLASNLEVKDSDDKTNGNRDGNRDGNKNVSIGSNGDNNTTTDILRRPNEQYYNLVDSMESFSSLLTKLEKKKRISLDIETNESKWARSRGTKKKSSPDPLSNTLAGIAISFEEEEGKVDSEGNIDTPIYSFYIPTCDYKSSTLTPDDFGVGSWEDQALVICALLQPILRSTEVFIHNVKFEMESMDKYNLTFRRVFDTFLAAYALRDEGNDPLNLKDIVKRRYSISMHNLDEYLDLKKTTDTRRTFVSYLSLWLW